MASDEQDVPLPDPVEFARLEESVRMRPDDVDALLDLGLAYLDAGDLDRAAGALDRVLAIDPRHHEACFNRGYIHECRGEWARARRHYQRGLEQEKDDPWGHCHLAHTLSHLGDLDGAEVAYRNAVTLDENDGEAFHGLGFVFLKRDQYSRAVPNLERAVALDPESAMAHYDLGYAYARLGRLDEAIVSFRKAGRLEPADPAVPFQIGCAHEGAGRHRQALASFQRVLDLDPEDALTLTHLGYCHLLLGRPQAALRSLDRAVAAASEDPEPLRYRGDACFDLGRLEDAVRDYRLALELDPNDADTHHSLGDVLREKGDLAGAEAAFNCALTADPTHTRASLDRAGLRLTRGAVVQAAEDYLEVAAFEPNRGYSVFLRGLAEALNGGLAAACGRVREALSVFGRSGDECGLAELVGLLDEVATAGRHSEAVRAAVAAVGDVIAEHVGVMPGAEAVRRDLASLRKKHGLGPV